MNSYPSISVLRAGGRTDLIGVAAGKGALPTLLEAAQTLAPSTWVVVDFAGIGMVSASAAREAVLQLCTFLNERGALPVLVNVNQETLEEVEVAFAAQTMKPSAVLAASVVDGEPSGLRILEELDAKHLQTLRVVAKLGEADAKTAYEASQDTSTGVTAWNNRLSTLAGMRLLRERKSGKTKYYSLVLKGLVDGN